MSTIASVTVRHPRTHAPFAHVHVHTACPVYRCEDASVQVDIYMHMGNSLNVAHLYDVYEDDSCVDLIMERCLGGDLWTRIRKGDYSEEGVYFLQASVCLMHLLRV